MSRISREEYSEAVRSVLHDDSALKTVLRALFEAKEGLYFDVNKERAREMIPLGEVVARKIPVSEECAQYTIDLSSMFYNEVRAYREDRTAWLEEQAGGVGEGPMQNADALCASLLYLAIGDKDECVCMIDEELAKEVHALFAETPMTDRFESIHHAPALGPDEIRRLGCLLGMLSYITLKAGVVSEREVTIDLSGIPEDLALDTILIWAFALTESRCASQEDELYLQDVAVVALCAVCSYSADHWDGQKAALDSLNTLTAADAFMLEIMTDESIDAREKLLDVYQNNERIRPLMLELFKALGAAGEMRMPVLAESITQKHRKAWHEMSRRMKQKDESMRAAALQQAQTLKENTMRTEKHRNKEKKHARENLAHKTGPHC